jgi:hypothetical protein
MNADVKNSSEMEAVARSGVTVRQLLCDPLLTQNAFRYRTRKSLRVIPLLKNFLSSTECTKDDSQSFARAVLRGNSGTVYGLPHTLSNALSALANETPRMTSSATDTRRVYARRLASNMMTGVTQRTSHFGIASPCEHNHGQSGS